MGFRAAVGEICSINEAQYSLRERWPQIQYLDTSSVKRGVILPPQRMQPGVDKIPSRARRKVKADDIVYSMVRPDQEHYAILKHPASDTLVSTGFSVISANSKIVNPRYLYYALTSKQATQALQALAEEGKSTYPTLSLKDLKSFEISLPPISVQKKIVAVLSPIEAKITTDIQINGYLAA